MNKKFSDSMVAAVFAALALPGGVALAADAPPDHSFTGNANLASDYRFRGISQTFKLPALQGGFDYAHVSGFYIGNWNSNVSGLSYPNGAGLEMDLYGGFKKTFGDFGFDVGLLQYYYPGAKTNSASHTKFDTLELYGAVSWRFLTLKYSNTLSDYFGVKTATFGGACNRDGVDCFGAAPGNSKGSGYLELNASYEIVPKLTLTGHIAQQKVRHYGKLDYIDYKIGATYDLNGWLLGAAFVTTDADKKWYYVQDGTGRVKETGKATVVFTLGRTF